MFLTKRSLNLGTHHLFRPLQRAAVGVMDDDELFKTKELVNNGDVTQSVTDIPASVADDHELWEL